MADRDARDERLRRAFQSLRETSREAPSDEDVQRIWRTTNEELSRSARRRAREAARRDMPWWTQPWVAAALVTLAVSAGLVLQLSRRPADGTVGEAGRYRIEPLVRADAVLPRDAFRLRWTRGPEGSRYHVRVTTEDLRLVTMVADLPSPQLLVERDALSIVAPGARVLWQVDVTLPEGVTVASRTFVVRVQ